MRRLLDKSRKSKERTRQITGQVRSIFSLQCCERNALVTLCSRYVKCVKYYLKPRGWSPRYQSKWIIQWYKDTKDVKAALTWCFCSNDDITAGNGYDPTQSIAILCFQIATRTMSRNERTSNSNSQARIKLLSYF